MDKPDTEKATSILDKYLTSKRMDQRFTTYHPYLTYSDPSNERFVRNGGKFGPVVVTEDTIELFRIGQEAYKKLPKVKSKEDFDSKLLPRYFKFIEKWRGILSDKCSQKTLKGIFLDWEDFNIAWDRAQEQQILAIAWHLYSNYVRTNTRGKYQFKRAFLFYSLREIDNSIIAMEIGRGGSIIAGIEASNALSNAISIESGSERLQEARQELAYNAALARHKKTTHVKRQEVKDYWRENIYPNHPKLSNEKSGEWLKDTFQELSVRKLAEYVAQAKKEEKKIRSAGKT